MMGSSVETQAKFGTAGNSTTFTETVSKSSWKAPEWLASIGLDCYEYQCGHGIRTGEEMGRKIGAQAEQANIALSIHSPYSFNLANSAPEAIENTLRTLAKTCELADFMGATRIVVHSGSLLKRSREESLVAAKEVLKLAVQHCDDLGYGHITFCPETMGKINQLGDLQEVLELCTLDERPHRIIPCVDFGHLYARSLGVEQELEHYVADLDLMESVLGLEKARVFHSHFSKIEFTIKGGEKRHLTFEENQGYGPDWNPLAEEVARRGWSPTFICESAGTQSEDALTMKRVYKEYLREGTSKNSC